MADEPRGPVQNPGLCLRLALLLPLAAGLGCAADSARWREDLPGAIREAGASGKPLLVVSIVGDLRKRC